MRWYEEHLGFRGYPFPEQEPFALASLLRDEVEVMLLRIDGYERPDIASCRPEGYWDAYIRMRGVHAFYEQVRPSGTIRMPLTKQDYGDWEFELVDPNGYILVFSELLDEGS